MQHSSSQHYPLGGMGSGHGQMIQRPAGSDISSLSPAAQQQQQQQHNRNQQYVAPIPSSNMESNISGQVPNTSLHTEESNSNDAPSPTLPTQSQPKEVDYYLNPTELFRWINYRRWDGAKARVLSHPDECSTWIVSRHSGDGRILWRHLPLHLVCMQSGGGSNPKSDEGKSPEELATQRLQVEDLIDTLLDAYPEAASSPDDQGMLPLHLSIANANDGLPNERILNLLLLANPRAVEIKDKYGRTPADILNEKNVGGAKYESAVRAMRRAQLTTSTLFGAARQEYSQETEALRSEADKERKANQLTILRLEEEVASFQKQTDSANNINKEEKSVRLDLEGQIKALNETLKKTTAELERLKEERDDLKDKNETLGSQVEDHDRNIQELHKNFENERASQIEEIADLRSEVNTSRAMAEAMENQLRSRFTNEEYLNTTVDELETHTNKIKAEFDKERRQLLHEKDDLDTEIVQLKKSIEELTSKNLTMQGRVTELNKQLSNVLSAQSTLNAEQDRMVDSAVRYESDLIDTMRLEREAMMAAMKKQKDTLEQSLREAEQIIEDAKSKEAELVDAATEERRSNLEIVDHLRQEFRETRASALERERNMQAENIHTKGRQGSGAVLGPSMYRNATSAAASISRVSTKKYESGLRSIASRASSRGRNATGRTSLPPSIIDRSRSSQRVPASPSASVSSEVSDDPSAVTNPSLMQDNSTIQSRSKLHIDTDDDRTNPDGNLLRILDDRAEQASSIAPSRVTRDSSSFRSARKVQDDRKNNTPLSRSLSKPRATRESVAEAHHHVKFAPGSWRANSDSVASLGASRDLSRNRSSGRYERGLSRQVETSSSASFSLDEYTQKSLEGSATDAQNTYRQFSGMRAGVKNQLIRVSDRRATSYAGKYGVDIGEDRNDASIGGSKRSGASLSRRS